MAVRVADVDKTRDANGIIRAMKLSELIEKTPDMLAHQNRIRIHLGGDDIAGFFVYSEAGEKNKRRFGRQKVIRIEPKIETKNEDGTVTAVLMYDVYVWKISM